VTKLQTLPNLESIKLRQKDDLHSSNLKTDSSKLEEAIRTSKTIYCLELLENADLQRIALPEVDEELKRNLRLQMHLKSDEQVISIDMIKIADGQNFEYTTSKTFSETDKQELISKNMYTTDKLVQKEYTLRLDYSLTEAGYKQLASVLSKNNHNVSKIDASRLSHSQIRTFFKFLNRKNL